MTKEVFSRVLDYNTGLTGASVLSALTIKYGAFQGFICQDYTVVQVVTDAQGNDVTAQMGLRGVTLSPGIYISMASGDSIYSIILSSGSIILYDLGADMSSVPGVSDLITAFSTRASVDGATLESTSCIDGPLMPYFKKASFYLTPSAYKEGKLYAQKPITGNGDLTWTRGGDGFRTNSSGLVQRMPWNLLQQSEDFTNAVWGKNNVTVSGNTTTAPNGTTTADTLTTTATTGRHLLIYGDHSATTITASIYVKKNTHNFIQIFTGWAAIAYANYDINNGVLGDVGSGTVASITNVGNGWYRCSFTSPAASASTIRWNLVTSSTAVYNESWTANGTESVYIWGAQLVEGTTAQTYLPTTDRLGFPRLDYTYGSCPAALLEPQRTNLATYSQEFNDASWSKLNGASVTANTAISPDGTTNADTLTFTSTADSRVEKTISGLTSGATYTWSVYLRVASGTLSCRLYGIDTTSGTAITVTDQWSRYTITQIASGTTRFPAIVGNGVAGSVFAYGAQLEAGAYSTTYIPTTSATATRVADSFSRSNIYTNGLISASGGTWFVELRNNVAYTRDSPGALYIGTNSIDANAGNGLLLRNPGGSTRILIRKVIGGVGTDLYQTITDTIKVAIKWNGTSADVFVNGTKQVSGTSFTTTNMEFLNLNSIPVPYFIQQMALFPAPLTDTECAAMTTI